MFLPDARLGIDSASRSWDTLGRKRYELSNHLGNVLATISDRRLQVANGSAIKAFDADVMTEQDYYAFGGLMDGRQLNAEKYRYGFNGKENDNDVNGTGNQQDYGMRIYDPRVGRFLSVDPLTKKYAWYTPYQFAGNTPIQAIDLDGAEPFIKAKSYAHIQDPKMNLLHSDNLVDMAKIKNPTSFNSLGWARQQQEFWKIWQDSPMGQQALSTNNRLLIAAKESPVVDEQWQLFMRQFGNEGELEEIIQHHHINRGRWAIPVPKSLHVGKKADPLMHSMAKRLGSVSQRYGKYAPKSIFVLNVGSLFLDSPNSPLYMFHLFGQGDQNRAYPTNDPNIKAPYYEWRWMGKPGDSLREATFFNDYERKNGQWRGTEQVDGKYYFDKDGKMIDKASLL